MNSLEKLPLSVLFVEDEDVIRDNYCLYLKKYFQKVLTASNGIDAYEYYLKHKPDILILDINIPKLNGLDVLKKIRENDFTTKVIILTAHTDVSYLLEATELKLSKYLVKPISRKELEEALDFVIEEMSKYKITNTKKIVINKEFYWDIETIELIKNNKTIDLTTQEKRILKLFFENINRTLDYETIVRVVWNDIEDDKIDSLKTAIKNLRKKLPYDLIQNKYSFGYKLSI